MIKDVTDLEVYNLSLELLALIYGFSSKLPRSENDLRSQIRRSAKSIPANIAEGFAKRSYEKEFRRFLKIAIGSSDETISHFRTIRIVYSRLTQEAMELEEKYKVLSKRINKL